MFVWISIINIQKYRLQGLWLQWGNLWYSIETQCEVFSLGYHLEIMFPLRNLR